MFFIGKLKADVAGMLDRLDGLDARLNKLVAELTGAGQREPLQLEESAIVTGNRSKSVPTWNNNREWTEADLMLCIEYRGRGMKTAAIGELVGRSRSAVCQTFSLIRVGKRGYGKFQAALKAAESTRPGKGKPTLRSVKS